MFNVYLALGALLLLLLLLLADLKGEQRLEDRPANRTPVLTFNRREGGCKVSHRVDAPGLSLSQKKGATEKGDMDSTWR